MRFTPATLAMALVLATVSSTAIGQRADAQIDPLSMTWVKKGEAAQRAGDLQTALDDFETALAVDPRNRNGYIAIAQVSQAQGLPGKAIRFYNEALQLDPTDVVALEGQGKAMVQKGAVHSAQENLAKMKTLCRGTCDEVASLQGVIDKGAPQQLTARAVPPKPTAAAEEKSEN